MNMSSATSLRSARGSVPTPDDLAITIRDRRFLRDRAPPRWWLAGDPVGCCWHLALSATFPRGEAFFVEAVKAHRDGADPRLAEEIRLFIQQEVNHSREHLTFNRLAVDAGYDLAAIDERLVGFINMTRGRPVIVNLAATMALEHFTAMLAHDILARPDIYRGADAEVAGLWRWHAVEEIEHKGVAYDTFLHATRDWSRWRRWRLQAVMMLVVTSKFVPHRIVDTLDLLAQDGLRGWRVKARLLWYLFGNPGLLRRVIPAWLSYFMPGFHPWNHDDRALITAADAELRAA